MNSIRALLLGCLAAAGAPSLTGCVAAALPALAAGTILKDEIPRGANPAEAGGPRVPIDVTRAASPDGSPAAAPIGRSYTLEDGTRVEILAGLPDAPGGDQAPPVAGQQTLSGAAGSTFALEDGTQVRRITGDLPAPGSITRSAASGPGLSETVQYDPFYSFALRQGTLPVAGSERRSMILEQPGTLAPTTRECSVHPAAVLVDLDPGRAVFDPEGTASGQPGFAAALAALRAQGVTVAWITGNTADRAGAVRRALIAAGLDPEGRDPIALLRYPEERKQTRRDDFAKEFCIVALAGDERGDFDELFQYLRDPSLAAPLEALIGQGWFLIPQPLS